MKETPLGAQPVRNNFGEKGGGELLAPRAPRRLAEVLRCRSKYTMRSTASGEYGHCHVAGKGLSTFRLITFPRFVHTM